MRVRCPECNSEQMDQGIGELILCHKCRNTWILEKPYNKEIER
jgi:hypothetical protein